MGSSRVQLQSLPGFRRGTAADAARLPETLEQWFGDVRWPLEVRDWRGGSYELGGREEHWSGRPLRVCFNTAGAARDVLRVDGLRFLERFLRGEVDLAGAELRGAILPDSWPDS